MSGVKLLILDVDGTLTDGWIFVAASGEFCKAFDVKDGYGIKHLLPQASIQAAIITGRTSEIVAYRAKELCIEHVYQGISDKVSALSALKERLGLQWEQIAYIGDDLNDLPAMERVGVPACPADAVPAVKERCKYICQAPGGHGAVREFIEYLIHNERLPALPIDNTPPPAAMGH